MLSSCMHVYHRLLLGKICKQRYTVLCCRPTAGNNPCPSISIGYMQRESLLPARTSLATGSLFLLTAIVRNIALSPSKSAMELPPVGEVKTSANRCKIAHVPDRAS
jgi:hypothetical protein